MFEGLVVLGLITIVLVYLGLPWWNNQQIRHLRDEVAQLRAKLDGKPPAVVSQALPAKTSTTPSLSQSKPASQQQPTKPVLTKTHVETQLAMRLPVWLGGVALICAGFFLVKYSMDNHLLSPAVRVSLGALFAVALVYAGIWMQTRSGWQGVQRLAQALVGAGLATAYVVSFAAIQLYHLLPLGLGLVLLLVISVAALVLALRHGPPIAVLALLGGFCTPLLMGVNSITTPLLFTYLYVVYASLLWLLRRQGWQFLVLPVWFGGFCWTIAWVLSVHVLLDYLYVGLFIVAVSATGIVLRCQNKVDGSAGDWVGVRVTDYLHLGVGLCLLATVLGQTDYSPMAWLMFAALACLGVALAYFKVARYGYVPYLAMLLGAAMLALWFTTDYVYWTWVSVAFATIYIVGGLLGLLRNRQPALFAGLLAATGTLYFLLAYFKLHAAALPNSMPLFWGGLAALAAVLTALLINYIVKNAKLISQRDGVLSILLCLLVAFVSLAFTLELDKEFLSIVFAAEVMTLAWLASRTPLPVLRRLAVAALAVFVLLLVPQFLLLLQLTLAALLNVHWMIQTHVPMLEWPLFQLGVPSVLLLTGSYFLRQRTDDALVRILELLALALLALMAYYVARHLFHADANVLFITPSFVERGILSNGLLVFAVICCYLARHYRRVAFTWAGSVLAIIALFRLIYFDVLLSNPWLQGHFIAGWPFVNTLLIPYIVPQVWLAVLLRFWQQAPWRAGCVYVQIARLVLLLAYVTLAVRHCFHGAYLNVGPLGNAEIYTYSAAWLLLGIMLLIFGMRWGRQGLRHAALLLIALAVGKVFLYDAAALQGLYRVLSFLGLGVCLLGLSFFYTKAVLKSDAR